jgi:hypothetical protein
VCKSVLFYCHEVSTQLQLNICHIIYHIRRYILYILQLIFIFYLDKTESKQCILLVLITEIYCDARPIKLKPFFNLGWVVNTIPRQHYPGEGLGASGLRAPNPYTNQSINQSISGKGTAAHCTGGWVGPQAYLEGCEKFRLPTQIRSPDRQTCNESLYRLVYSGLHSNITSLLKLISRVYRFFALKFINITDMIYYVFHIKVRGV